MEVDSPLAEPGPSLECEWPPTAESDSVLSAASMSPTNEDESLELDPSLEAALLNESDAEAEFAGFEPVVDNPPVQDTTGDWSSGESLPGSPGDLVIAESGSEAEGRGRRATSAAPSTASDVSSSSSKSRSRLVDPSLPLYRKPFEYGFKRELVWRSTYDIKKNREGDIYYYPPIGKKLRSSVEVARYLAENKIPLELECFTFAKQALGMNDANKEVIRLANTGYHTPPVPKKAVPKKQPAPVVQKPSPKVPGMNGGPGPSRPPKRARKSTFQDPMWHTSDVKKGGLAPCGLHCKASPDQPPSLQCSMCVCLYHPVCVGLTQLDSSILHGYVCPNCRPQKPAAAPKPQMVPKMPPSLKPLPMPKLPQKGTKPKQKPTSGGVGDSVQALAVLDGRQYVVVPKGPHLPPPPPPPQEGSLPVGRPAPAEPQSSASPMRPIPTSFSTDLAARMSAMSHIFSFLNVKELLRASRVCTSWRLLAENRPLWKIVRLKNSGIRSWKECAQWLSRGCTEALDMRKMLLPSNSDWWGEAAVAINQVATLRSLEMSRCSGSAVAIVATNCPRLEALSASSLSPDVDVNLASVAQLGGLRRLRLRGAGTPLTIINLPSLQDLRHLSCLSITNVSPLPGEDVAQVLNDLPRLELLELGECGDMVQNAEILTEVIAKLQQLKRLRLEHLVSQQHNAELLVTFFESLTVLPKLQHLELVHVEAPPGCDQQLARLAPLRSLLLLPSFAHQGSVTSQVLLRGVAQLKNLRRLVIGVTASISDTAHQLHLQKVARSSPQYSPTPQPSEDCIPVATPVPLGKFASDFQARQGGKLDNIEILPSWHLRHLLKEALPNAAIDVRRLSQVSRFSLDDWSIHV